MTIIGIILGLVAGIYVIFGRGDNHENDRDEYPSKREEKRRKAHNRRRFIWLIVILILAVLAIILFILTEDMRLPMVMVDRWTILHAIILLLEIVALVFCFRRRRYDDDDDEREINARDRNQLQLVNDDK